jgi:hypothetical protein
MYDELFFDLTSELANPSITTLTDVQWSTLPTECDGYQRVSAISSSTKLSTKSYTTRMSGTLRKGSTLPFSPHPTTFWWDHRGQFVKPLSCVIPPQECNAQWEIYLNFLRSYLPDLADYGPAYEYYRHELDKYVSKPGKEFILYGIDWGETGNFPTSGLLTGSPFLDTIVHLSHRNGLGSAQFFGGCEEAQKALIQDCQNLLKNNGTTFPFNFSGLSTEEATKLIVKHLGCSLHAAHARIIHFDPKIPTDKRDICAAGGWGEAWSQATPASGERGDEAVWTEIPFPPYYDNSKFNWPTA